MLLADTKKAPLEIVLAIGTPLTAWSIYSRTRSAYRTFTLRLQQEQRGRWSGFVRSLVRVAFRILLDSPNKLAIASMPRLKFIY